MNIIKLNATASTNNYLKNLVRESPVEDETAVLTIHQTQGRGQRENSWYSKSEESLAFSLFKRFHVTKVEAQFKINMAVSIHVKEQLSAFEVPQVSVKWPNDIMSANKKIGGILIENTLRQQYVKHAVIGIGLNVNNDVLPHLPQASSMKIQSEKTFSISDVFLSLTKSCFEELRKMESIPFSTYRDQYESILFRIDEKSEFENSENQRFEAEIKGVSNTGELLIEHKNGLLKQIQVKELKMIY